MFFIPDINKATLYQKSYTATDDGAFQVDSEERTGVLSINIHCYTNDAYYGNGAFQLGILRANAVLWFEGRVKVSDLWFKNLVAGQNATIVISGVLENGIQ